MGNGGGKGARTFERDRRTEPAPASTSQERPTSVPDYDLESLAASVAWEARLATQHLPFDLSVPIRRRGRVDGVALRAAFLLSHVDDRATIAELAMTAQVPLDEAIACFARLAELHLVDFHDVAVTNTHVDAEPSALPGSELRRKPTS